MKKQIFILLLALLASSTVVWSQTIPLDPDALTSTAAPYCVPATPILAACVPASGPLNPIPGTLYNYSVTIANGGTSPTIHWIVTTNANFITAGVLTTSIETTPTSDVVMATGTTYNDPANTTPNVDITWKAFPTTMDVFLITYVQNDAGCTDNIKVYKITPVHVFTLDLAALNFDGTLNTTRSNCVSSVQGANYDAGSNTVLMDYGLNYIYFTVNAANYAHSWMPTFQVSATNMTASSTLAVDWAYPDESYGATAVWHTTTPAGAIFTSNDAVLPGTAGSTGVGAAGECIVVRVTVDHNLNETLADIVLSFAVDGTAYDQINTNYTNPLLGDIHWTDGGPANPCPWYDGYTNDVLTFTLTRRPTLTDQTDPDPADNFIPDNGE